mmetsp:Transcript_8690/g.26129  ORF Transcript_8690/g.26129 Transcript_8690/m.26129 type:complete len:888 (+) Transcript_8690:129-2792(+)
MTVDDPKLSAASPRQARRSSRWTRKSDLSEAELRSNRSRMNSPRASDGHTRKDETGWAYDALVHDDDAYSTEFNVEFAPRKHRFNMINFRLPLHTANLRELFPQSSRQESLQYVTVFVLAALAGLLVAFVGWLMEAGVRWASFGLYRLAQTSLIEQGRIGAGIASYVLLATALAAGASGLVLFVSPLAAGSGIPEIKSYLNGVQLPGLLKYRTLIAKGVGVCLSISSGFICGREGPMIHCGGIVGGGIVMAASRTVRGRLPFKWWNYFRTEHWKRDFTALGSAAGVAVAFQAPLGGVLFVMEEAATHWNQTMTWATLMAAAIAALVGSSFEELAHGHLNIDMSSFGFVYGPLSNQSFYLKDMGFFIIIGVLGGLFGALLSAIQKPLTLFRFKYVSTAPRRLCEALLINCFTNLVRLLVPALTNICLARDEAFDEALEQKFHKDFSRFKCAEGEYNLFASLMWNPIDVVVENLMHNKNPVAWTAGALFAALAFYAFFTILTYGIAVPSGLFIPAFIVGALIGRLVGLLAYVAFPDDRSDFSMGPYVFIGAVAGLAGATRMTMSVVMIAAETSAFGTGLVPAFIAALVAKFVGDSINTGIYDLHIDLKGIPILESRLTHATELYYSIRCRDVMERNVAAVYDLSKVSDLVSVLKRYHHGSFPVVSRIYDGVDFHVPHEELRKEGYVVNDPAGLVDFSRLQFKGMIERRTILANLKHLVTIIQSEEGDIRLLPRDHYDIAYPNTNLLRCEDQILSDIEGWMMDRVVDLNPYVDRNPDTISDKACVAEARDMFRRTGARHIVCVWLKTGNVVGIMTRKDVLPETLRDVSDEINADDGLEDYRFKNPKLAIQKEMLESQLEMLNKEIMVEEWASQQALSNGAALANNADKTD